MFERKSAARRSISKDMARLHPTLNLTRTVARDLLDNHPQVWDSLPYLHNHIRKIGDSLSYEEFDEIAENVWVHVSAYLAPTCKIEAPAIICGGAKICHYAHVEGSVIGAFAVVGETGRVKNSVMFDRSSLGSHSSILTSIVGYEAILGDGCRITDTRLDAQSVSVDMPDGIYASGREHLGGIICDGVKIGVSCVINPGTVIDAYSRVYPLTSVSGYVYPYTTVK